MAATDYAQTREREVGEVIYCVLVPGAPRHLSQARVMELDTHARRDSDVWWAHMSSQ